ncbi:hypothetical protein JOM56_011121 [Amanita muscaria]
MSSSPPPSHRSSSSGPPTRPRAGKSPRSSHSVSSLTSHVLRSIPPSKSYVSSLPRYRVSTTQYPHPKRSWPPWHLEPHAGEKQSQCL